MTRDLHLAIVSPLPPGGAATAIYGQYVVGGLAQSRCFKRITVLADRCTPPEAPRPGRYLQVERLWRRNSPFTAYRLLRRLRQLRPDAVWYNVGITDFGNSALVNFLGLSLPLFSRTAGIPTVVTLHEDAVNADLRALGVSGGMVAQAGARVLQRVVTAGADVVCVLLCAYAEQLASSDRNLDVMHIPHGLLQAPEQLPPATYPNLLFFGTIAPYKGCELLLSVYRRLRARYPALTLTIAGFAHPRFPAYYDTFRQQAVSIKGVRWLGFVPEEALRDVFQRASVVVLPYMAASGSSSVLYRAAGWGRPVVASDVPYLRATAAEADLKITTFTRGDAAALERALLHLLASTDLPARQAAYNVTRVRTGLTLQHTVQAYLTGIDRAREKHKAVAKRPLVMQEDVS